MAGVAYVYVLPRTYSPRSIVHVGFGGIAHDSCVIYIRATPRVKGGLCADESLCEGPWVRVMFKPTQPTEQEQEELDALPDQMYDSGMFKTTHGDFFGASIPLTKLRDDTEYFFEARIRFSSDKEGISYRHTFRTLPKPGEVSSKPLSFLFGSCLMSRSWPFDYSALIDPEGPVMQMSPRPSFAALLGDSVYLDSYWNLSPEESYHQRLESLTFRRLSWNLPVFFSLDDHEISNDADDTQSPAFLTATSVWDSFLGRRNSPRHAIAGATALRQRRDHSFWLGPCAIYILDTRSHRSPKLQSASSSKTMLGSEQLSRVRQWIADTQTASWRIVLSGSSWSSCMGRGDGWRHYMTEREQLLDELTGQKNGPKLLLLSGDVHFAYVAQIRPNVMEVSCSPITAVPLRRKLASSESCNGEEVLFTSQLKQFLGRVDVVGTNITVSIFSEIPGLGASLAHQVTIG